MNYESRVMNAILLGELPFGEVYVQAGVRSRHFSDDFSKIVFEKCEELFLSKYDIDPEIVKSKIKVDKSINATKSALFINRIDKLDSDDVKSFKFSLDELERDRRAQDLQSVLLEAANDLKDGNVDDAYKKLNKAKSLGNRRVQAIVKDLVGEECWEARQDERLSPKEPKNGIFNLGRFGFFHDHFDGFTQETTSIFGGVTGIGKSLFLLNLAEVACSPSNGKNGLFIAAENNVTEVEDRWDAISLKRDYAELKKSRKKNDHDGISFHKNAFDEGWGKLRLVKMPQGKFTVLDIEEILLDLISEGEKIDFIVFDSPDHMKSIEGYSEFWLEKEAVYWDIKEFAERHKLIVFCSIQLTDIEGKEFLTSQHAAGAKSIVRVVDNAFFFKYTQQDVVTGRRRLQDVKVRDGKLLSTDHYMQLENTLRFEQYSAPPPKIDLSDIDGNIDNPDGLITQEELAEKYKSARKFKLKK